MSESTIKFVGYSHKFNGKFAKEMVGGWVGE